MSVMMVLVQAEPEELNDDADYRVVIEDLIADWDRRQWDGRRVEPDGMEQFLLVTGLAAHGYEQARAYLAALDVVPEVAAIPLVRAVYEGAVTAQWLALVLDGWRAVAQEHARQRRALASELREMRTPVYDVLADRVEELVQHDPDLLVNPHTTQGSSFVRRCADLLPRDLYLHFRLASSTAHPTVAVPELWIHGPSTPGGPARVVKPAPGTGGDGDGPSTVAISLLLLAGAQTVLDGDLEREDYLASVARRIGTVPNLQLSDTYRDRMADR